MEGVKAIIFEDELFTAMNLKNILEGQKIIIVNTFYQGEDFLTLDGLDFDTAFIDIQLAGQVDGIEIAKKMNQLGKPFVYITANTESGTIEKAAKTFPVTYIPKPFNELNVKIALELLKPKIVKGLKINGQTGKREINFDTILFIKSDDVYIEIYTVNEKITHRQLLKEVADELPPQFKRVHRSYIVNANKIDKIFKKKLIINGEEVPVSKSYEGILSSK